MFRATRNGYCNKERVRTPVLVQKRLITPSLFSYPVYTNLTQYIPDERRGMEELAFPVPEQVYEPVLYCNIHCELRGTSVAARVDPKNKGSLEMGSVLEMGFMAVQKSWEER